MKDDTIFIRGLIMCQGWIKEITYNLALTSQSDAVFLALEAMVVGSSGSQEFGRSTEGWTPWTRIRFGEQVGGMRDSGGLRAIAEQAFIRYSIVPFATNAILVPSNTVMCCTTLYDRVQHHTECLHPLKWR